MNSFSCFCTCFGDRASAALPEAARGGRDLQRGHRWRRPTRFLSRLIRRGKKRENDRDQEHVVQDVVIGEIDHRSDLEHSTQEEIVRENQQEEDHERDFVDMLFEEEDEESSQSTSFTAHESEPRLALAGTEWTGTIKSSMVHVMFFCALFLLFIFANVQRPVQGTGLVLGEPSFEQGQVAIDYSWIYARWCISALFCVGFVFVVYSIHDILFAAILIILYLMHRFEHRYQLGWPNWFRWLR